MTRRIVYLLGSSGGAERAGSEAWGRGATGMQDEKLEGAVSSVKRIPSRSRARGPAWKS